MEFIIQRQVGREILEELNRLLYSMGPPPLDIVVVGADETRLEVGDVFVLKVATPIDRYRVLREVAAAHALADPQLVEIWGIPDDVEKDSLAYELSLALFNRLVDSLVARVDYELVAARGAVEVVEGETILQTLVRTMAVDMSLSLAVAGRVAEAARLLTSISSHPIYPQYRRLWDFAVENFKFLPIYNWLLLVY